MFRNDYKCSGMFEYFEISFSEFLGIVLDCAGNIWICFEHVWSKLRTSVDPVCDVFGPCLGYVWNTLLTCSGHSADKFGLSLRYGLPMSGPCWVWIRFGHVWRIIGRALYVGYRELYMCIYKVRYLGRPPRRAQRPPSPAGGVKS